MAIFFSRGVEPLEYTELAVCSNQAEKVDIRVGDPSDLGSKALNVVLLALQHILRHEQGERAVLDTHLLDTCVEPLLDLLPDEV